MLINPKGHVAVMSLSPQLTATLKTIHDGSVTNGVHFANPGHPMVAALVKSGHVETDNTRIDPNDGKRVAIVLTLAGHTENGSAAGAQTAAGAVATDTPITGTLPCSDPAPAPAPEKARRTRSTVVPEVRLTSGFMALPTTGGKRGGNRNEVYAFGKLEAPQADGQMHSFFVPATDENPNPADTIRAAVSSANARYKDKGGAVFKHFIMDSDPEHGVAGVRVFRVK